MAVMSPIKRQMHLLRDGDIPPIPFGLDYMLNSNPTMPTAQHTKACAQQISLHEAARGRSFSSTFSTRALIVSSQYIGQ
jgi:hypothetical protein